MNIKLNDIDICRVDENFYDFKHRVTGKSVSFYVSDEQIWVSNSEYLEDAFTIYLLKDVANAISFAISLISEPDSESELNKEDVHNIVGNLISDANDIICEKDLVSESSCTFRFLNKTNNRGDWLFVYEGHIMHDGFYYNADDALDRVFTGLTKYEESYDIQEVIKNIDERTGSNVLINNLTNYKRK